MRRALFHYLFIYSVSLFLYFIIIIPVSEFDTTFLASLRSRPIQYIPNSGEIKKSLCD